MIGTSASRGLCPCDPRIYPFPASPAWTPEASAARLRRVRPRNRRSGSRPRVALSSVRSRSVYAKPRAVEVEISCGNGFWSAKKDLSLSVSVGRFSGDHQWPDLG